MVFKRNVSKDKNGKDPESISGFGGYSTRHEYERSRNRENPYLKAAKILLVALLFLLAATGIIALIRGDFFPEQEENFGPAGSIKVPTQSQLSEVARDLDEVIGQVQGSLVTLEIENADGSFRRGTGFLVSDDGFAVCSSHLFASPELLKTPSNMTAYTNEGFSVSFEVKGTKESLGITLVRLEESFSYTPIGVKNSAFIERGETLVAVGAHKAKLFYGTVSSGLVSSVGPSVKVEDQNVNLLYLDLAADETLYGAPVMDTTGAVAGFLTRAIAPLYGKYAPVVPINTVYTVINEMISQE